MLQEVDVQVADRWTVAWFVTILPLLLQNLNLVL